MGEQASLAALLSAQRDLGVALGAETSLDRALALVVETAIELAGMGCGGIYLMDPDTGALHLRYHTGLPDEFVRAMTYLPPDSSQAHLVRAGQSIYTRYDELIVPLDDLRRRSGIAALAVLPIAHAGQVIGCLNLGSPHPDQFPAEIRHTLETLAAQTGSAIARIRAEEALRTSEDTARALLKGVSRATGRLLAIANLDVAINEALAVLGEATGVSRVFIFRIHPHPVSGEPAASLAYEWAGVGVTPRLGLAEYQNLGWSTLRMETVFEQPDAGQILDSNAVQLRQPMTEPLFSHRTLCSLAVRIFVHGEFWGTIGLEHEDLAWQWQQEHRSALRTLANSLGAAVARHKAETRLRQERDAAQLLRDTALALTSTLELDDLLARMLEQVGRAVSYEAACVFLIEDEVAHLVRRQAADPRRRDPPGGKRTMALTDFPLLRRVVHDQEACVVPYVDREPDWQLVPDTEHIASWLAVPIIHRGQVLGLFGLESTQPGFYSSEHVLLVSPIAMQAGVALANARLFANIQRLEQTKSEMIRLASHDLRSPLTRIMLLTERLLNRGIAARDPQSRQDLTRIREAASNMEHLVDQILSLERIEARHRTLEVVNWCGLTIQAINALQTELDAKQLRLSLVCPEEMPTIRGDPVQLYHAAHNLLHNAIKYTPPGGTVEVRVRLQRIGEHQTLVFEVEDSGIGIPEDQQSNLFEPFFRAANAGTVRASGVGLGLTVVKAVVEHHRGRVYCESTPGKGSLFGFWVPTGE